jgi:tetratricopeptide (TPR) repeat protein
MTTPGAEIAGRSIRPGRALKLLAALLPIAFLIVALLVLPGWVPLWPRELRRALVEGFLRGVLVAYMALLVAGLLGTPLACWRLVRAWRSKRGRRVWERAFLASFGGLIALATLEVGSVVWRGWMHRFPVLPTSFPAADPEEFRLVVLGGSSALGEPYRPVLSVGQIVAWRLQEAMPGRKVIVENLAGLGESLEQQHLKLRSIRHKPDAIMIYSGHNEFAARFEENRDYSLAEEPRARLLQAAYGVSLRSPFCRLVYELVSKNRLDSPPLLNGHHRLIDPPLCGPSEMAAILADFAGRLEALVRYAERLGARPILIIPPANEADYEPGRSTLPDSASQPEREQLVREFRRAREVEAGDPDASIGIYRNILSRHPRFAEAHYRLGRLLVRRGRVDEAREHFEAALDDDGLPIRCQKPFREAYRQVAAGHPGCILIDGRRELMATSPTGLLDDHVIEDTHHPNLMGYLALAGAVLREWWQRRAGRDRFDVRLPIDPRECVAHFGLDRQALATACDRTSVHYRRVAGYRYDPAERLEKSRRFAEAARRLRDGEPLDRLGVSWMKELAASPAR